MKIKSNKLSVVTETRDNVGSQMIPLAMKKYNSCIL